MVSHPRHKAIHHAFFAGFVELDGELVAVDGDHFAIAEFLVKDAVAAAERRGRAGRARHQLAFDGERRSPPP